MTFTLTQMGNRVLIVVPCGKKKIWDKIQNKDSAYAKNAYISPYFKLCRKYAEKFADKWVILSAKYGFIEPDFIIPKNYDVSFNNSKNEVISFQRLKVQIKKLRFQDYQSIVILGGKEYTDVVQRVLKGFRIPIKVPLESLGIGKRQAKIKEALTKGISL